MPEHDFVAEANREGRGDALTIQECAVLAAGIADDETAARTNGQLGVYTRDDRVVRGDRLDFALAPATQPNAGATRFVALARRGREQRDAVRTLLRPFRTRRQAGMLGERGLELSREDRDAILRP